MTTIRPSPPLLEFPVPFFAAPPPRPLVPLSLELRDPARSPILARPPACTPAAALLARLRWAPGIGAGPRYRCCPDRAGMAGSGRSSTPHKPATGSPTDRFQVPNQKG